ncbi:MAG: haloacid dehalogenase-like hydrolase [Eubacterium sp.]|nr:haloacid dehalogenase-like hydrolase [Eubacterium sp.]
MREVDIYDFDKTLVPFDSGTAFVLFCSARYPWILPMLPVTGFLCLLGTLKLISWTTFKKVCFSFMRFIPRERAIKAFWDKNESRAFKWFKERKRESVVISASPDFLLEEAQKRLGFDVLICSRHDKRTGRIIGKNCRGEEKVRRFYETLGNGVRVADVYSDSVDHDKPIFSLATGKCYHIVDGIKNEFDFKDKYKE